MAYYRLAVASGERTAESLGHHFRSVFKNRDTAQAVADHENDRQLNLEGLDRYGEVTVEECDQHDADMASRIIREV